MNHRLLALALPLLAVLPATAQDDADALRDPAAIEAAQAALDQLEAAERFSFRLRRVQDVVQESGQRLQFVSRGAALVQRPDRLRLVRTRDDGQRREITYGGGEIVVLDVGENAYARFDVPPTIDGTLDFLELEVGSPLPIADLLYSDLDFMTDAATEAIVVGPAVVGAPGIDTQHLAFRGERIDWQLWIDDEDLIRKVVVTYPELPGAPQIGVVFDSWDLDADPRDDAFTFTAPAGAQQIPALARPPERPAEEVDGGDE